MAFTTYLDNLILNIYFGANGSTGTPVAYTPPANLYIGLSTTTPAVGGTGVSEPSGNAYARVTVANTTTNWPNASGGSKSNGAAITFPAATGSWGTVTYFVIYDASTAGNLIGYGALNTAQTVANGDTLSFATSALTVSLS